MSAFSQLTNLTINDGGTSTGGIEIRGHGALLAFGGFEELLRMEGSFEYNENNGAVGHLRLPTKLEAIEGSLDFMSNCQWSSSCGSTSVTAGDRMRHIGGRMYFYSN